VLLQRGRRTFAFTIAGEHGGILARDRKWSGDRANRHRAQL
jgi:hypothetical protein